MKFNNVLKESNLNKSKSRANRFKKNHETQCYLPVNHTE